MHVSWLMIAPFVGWLHPFMYPILAAYNPNYPPNLMICHGELFSFCFFVFQRGFVASVAFVGVWLYHALPIYVSFYLSNLTNLT